MLDSAATPIGTTGASEPPASTTSHSPAAISRSASWNAMTDVAHAATWVMTGPVRPYSIDSRQPAIDPDSAGIANGDTNRGPFWSWTWVPSMISSIPPPPVFTTTPTRSRCSSVIAAKSMPDERDRLLARAHREVDEAAHPAGHLGVHHGRRVVAEHLGRDLDLEPGRVEGLDAAGPGDRVAQVRPVGLEVVADRHHGAETGHDRASRGISRGHGTPSWSGLRPGDRCPARGWAGL